LLETIRTRDGRVLRWTSIPGSVGVPVVAIDGSTGGLSRDGRTLVLASYAGIPSARTSTTFALVSTRSSALARSPCSAARTPSTPSPPTPPRST
jgi:hypothetical protein